MILIFWQSILSIHQTAYIRAVAQKKLDWQIIWVVEEVISEDRKQMGWQIPTLPEPNIKILTHLTKEQIVALVQTENAVHIVGGIKGTHLGWSVVKQCKKRKIPIIVMSEDVDLRGHRATTRRVYSYLIEKRFKKIIKGIFCIGEKAKEWYMECGYEVEKCYDFIYTVLQNEDGNKKKYIEQKSGIYKMIVIASLIELKGYERFLESLYNFETDVRWQLDIIGEGELKNKLLTYIKTHKMDNVRFLGNLPHNELLSRIELYDLLISPSTYDGWNVTINEALMAGTPVLCSEACGASSLIKNDFLGKTFSWEIKGDFESKLAILIKDRENNNEKRDLIINWANNIEGNKVADYFVNCLEHIMGQSDIKPTPPWLLVQ